MGCAVPRRFGSGSGQLSSVSAFGFDQRGVLDAIAHAVDCEVGTLEGGLIMVQPGRKPVATVSLTAENMTARELLAICAPDLVVAPDAGGLRATMSLFVGDADWRDVAAAIATAAGRTVERRLEEGDYEWR